MFLQCVNVNADRGRDAADSHTMPVTVSLLNLHSTDGAMKNKQTVQHHTNPYNNYPNEPHVKSAEHVKYNRLHDDTDA